MVNFHVWNDRCGNNVVHVEGRQFWLHTIQIWRRVQSEKKRIPVILMTEHLVNFTKLGLRFHHNAHLIKNAYCNCETPILFQLFKQNLATLFSEMERKKKKEKKKKKKKKKNNNRCIIH